MAQVVLAGACSLPGGRASSPADTPIGFPTATPRPTAARTPTPPATSPTTSPATSPGIGFDFDAGEIVATGLDVPWAIAFTADGDAIVTERETGRFLRVRPGDTPVEVGRMEDVAPEEEAGLLGIAAAPPPSDELYLYYGTQRDHRLVKLRLGTRRQVLLAGIPGSPFHTGGRLAFGPDGMLYVSVGDATSPESAMDADSLTGKILRLAPDGTIPADNPFPQSAVWSRGHRNVEGFTWDDAGRMWATELGEDRFDELNRIVPGGNYGWPVVEGPGGGPDIDPVLTWSPAEASPAAIAFARGSLWIAALRGTRLWQVPIDAAGRPGRPVAHLVGAFGRLRIVEVGPDGWLWVGTSNRDGRGGPPGPADDRIVRFPPLASP
jgi:glucose/arabinose dehydrogenase